MLLPHGALRTPDNKVEEHLSPALPLHKFITQPLHQRKKRTEANKGKDSSEEGLAEFEFQLRTAPSSGH
jgi:hypothetical protein